MKNENSDKIAVCYASNRAGYDKLEIATWSFRKYIGDNIPMYVLTESHWKPNIYGAKCISPIDPLREAGFFEDNWGRKLPFASLYRLAIPLLPELNEYDKIVYIDTDTLIMSEDAKNSLFGLDDFDSEVKAATDVDSTMYRNKELSIKEIDDYIKDDLKESWNKWNTISKPYVNAGVVIFNLKKIRSNGLEWYMRRLKMFWEIELQGRFEYLDQDFINMMMDVDTTLDKKLDVMRPEDCVNPIIRHYVWDKSNQYEDAKKLGYHNLAAFSKDLPTKECISSSKQAILFISHIVNEETIWRYRKLEKDMSGKCIDIIWIYDSSSGSDKSIPEDIKTFTFSGKDIDSNQQYSARPGMDDNRYHSAVNFATMSFSEKHREYDYIWIIEYDVCFSGNWRHLLDELNNISCDLICEWPQTYDQDWKWDWWSKLGTTFRKFDRTRTCHAYNCICRLSRKLLNYINKAYDDKPKNTSMFYEHSWATLAMNIGSVFDISNKISYGRKKITSENEKTISFSENYIYICVKDSVKWSKHC